MTTPTTLRIDDVDYVRADSTDRTITDSPVKIVVLEGRWNLVGRYSIDGDHGVLDDAKVIRYWGTTKGLGELAKNGPTSKTILDPCNGQVRFGLGKQVLTLDCEASKW